MGYNSFSNCFSNVYNKLLRIFLSVKSLLGFTGFLSSFFMLLLFFNNFYIKNWKLPIAENLKILAVNRSHEEMPEDFEIRYNWKRGNKMFPAFGKCFDLKFWGRNHIVIFLWLQKIPLVLVICFCCHRKICVWLSETSLNSFRKLFFLVGLPTILLNF